MSRLHLFPWIAPYQYGGAQLETTVDPRRDNDLDTLWREHGPKLWRAVLAYAGDREIASDAVAESFAQCLRRGEEIRSPAAWIWRAAFRVAAGELKRRGRWTPPADEGSYLMPEPAVDLLRALASLPRKQRASLVLHYYGDYSTREAAEILGSTAATVRVHLSQGRRRLKHLLEGSND